MAAVVGSGEDAAGNTQVTMSNVHTLSTFELRQECERRGLALPAVVNHRTLLQCLVKRLVEDQGEAERQLLARLDAERAQLQERLAREKAERKAAAVERSRVRQEQAARDKVAAGAEPVLALAAVAPTGLADPSDAA
jgi:hypothetical protein